MTVQETQHAVGRLTRSPANQDAEHSVLFNLIKHAKLHEKKSTKQCDHKR